MMYRKMLALSAIVLLASAGPTLGFEVLKQRRCDCVVTGECNCGPGCPCFVAVGTKTDTSAEYATKTAAAFAAKQPLAIFVNCSCRDIPGYASVAVTFALDGNATPRIETYSLGKDWFVPLATQPVSWAGATCYTFGAGTCSGGQCGVSTGGGCANGSCGSGVGLFRRR